MEKFMSEGTPQQLEAERMKELKLKSQRDNAEKAREDELKRIALEKEETDRLA